MKFFHMTRKRVWGSADIPTQKKPKKALRQRNPDPKPGGGIKLSAKFVCKDCGKTYQTKNISPECPDCGSMNHRFAGVNIPLLPKTAEELKRPFEPSDKGGGLAEGMVLGVTVADEGLLDWI